MKFTEQLTQAWAHSNSLLCVGLDPDPSRFPKHLADHPDRVYEFCRQIIDATAPYACVFKPQVAYFSASGQESALERLIAYIHKQYPFCPVILDAKRGDIGATAQQYAREAFVRYQADALTVSPYMGFDSLEPYLDYKDKGIIVLCRTSNPGGSDLQALNVSSNTGLSNMGASNGGPLYQTVAKLVSKHWNQRTGQLALVVGATFPDELASVRRIVGDLPILVPGIGAQGGDIDATVAAGVDQNLNGLMISSSRAILYASSGEDFAEAAGNIACATRDAINSARFKA